MRVSSVFSDNVKSCLPSSYLSQQYVGLHLALSQTYWSSLGDRTDP